MSEAATAIGGVKLGSETRTRRRVWDILRPEAAVALGFLGLLVGLAIFAPWVTPYDPNRNVLIERLTPPAWGDGGTWAHPLGTDGLGRDIATRTIYGARVSLLVGASAVLFGGGFGLLAGLLAGYFGGRVDQFFMRLGDVQLALPFILIALAVLAIIGPGIPNVILVLSVGQWVEYARVARGEVLSLREREFVLGAKVIGQRDRNIIRKHILPNVLPTILVLASLAVGNVILAEASLTFLGSGVGIETASWGGMIAQARDSMSVAGWLATAPGIVLMLTILAINIVGDWMRDVLDPRLRST